MAVFTVTNATDTVADGDGMSLREALLAAQAAPGDHTIMVAAALAGQVIHVQDRLPHIDQAGLTILGNDVILDFAGTPDTPGMAVWSIHASHTAVSGFSFTGLGSTQVGLFVEATEPLEVLEDIVVSDCSFQGAAGQAAYAVRIGTSHGTEAVDAIVRGVTVEGCSFTDYLGDATTVHLQASGTGNAIEEVVVNGNQFTRSTFAVELVVYEGSGARIEGTRVQGNTFTDNVQPVTLFGGNHSLQGSIAGTVVSGNRFTGSQNPSVAINAGSASAAGNVIAATLVENNLFVSSQGVWVGGGAGTGNSVQGLLVTNNTMALGGGLALVPSEGGSGNSVSGLVLQNTVFAGGGNDFFGPITAAQVFNCIFSDSPLNTLGLALAGVNGNMMTDPQFVDSANGDFRLLPASPAIDAGNLSSAPALDAAGGPRVDDLSAAGPSAVDIGAFEYAGSALADDVLDFGAGVQSLRVAGALAAYSIDHEAGVTAIDGPAGSDLLYNLERLAFDDRSLAFDLGAGEAGANTVRIIGTVFGSEAIAAHPEWVGLGLGWFDAGATVQQVCGSLAAALRWTDEFFVTTLYANVMGHAPTDAEVQAFVAVLQAGMTQAQLMAAAAATEFVAAQIGLTGMQQTGVEFMH